MAAVSEIKFKSVGLKNVTLTLTQRDLGLERILKEFKKLQKHPYSMIGIQASSDSQLILIATAHEFGAPKANIPERSFIRSTMRDHGDELRKYANDLMQQIFASKEMTVEKAIGLLGEKIQSLIQAKIQSNIPPPLKPETILRKNHSQVSKAQSKIRSIGRKTGPLSAKDNATLKKASATVLSGGSSVALIDTGRMLHAIRHKEVLGG